MKKYVYNNLSYLGNYKVFCFSDVILPKLQIKESYICYNINDLVPTAGYSYIYGRELLILDYFNKVIHVIVNSKYCELIKMHKDSLEVYEDSCLFDLNIEKINVIDIYGNLLNIKSIDDIVISMVEFPIVETVFVKNNYVLSIGDVATDSEMLFDSVSYSECYNKTFITGTYKSLSDDFEGFKAIGEFKKQLCKSAEYSFKKQWFLKEDFFDLMNCFLLNIRLLYLLETNNIGLPVSYYWKDIKYVTHINKIQQLLRNIVLYCDVELIECIMEKIFRETDFDDEYNDFIISFLSIIMDSEI